MQLYGISKIFLTKRCPDETTHISQHLANKKNAHDLACNDIFHADLADIADWVLAVEPLIDSNRLLACGSTTAGGKVAMSP